MQVAEVGQTSQQQLTGGDNPALDHAGVGRQPGIPPLRGHRAVFAQNITRLGRQIKIALIDRFDVLNDIMINPRRGAGIRPVKQHS